LKEEAVIFVNMRNLYAILNIKPVSSAKEIKSAYRELAKKHHPDNGGESQYFRDIQEAYETLSDPAQRKKYDMELSSRPFGGRPFRTVLGQSHIEPRDVFDDLVDVLSRRFDFGSERTYDIDITLSGEEARQGVNLELRIPRSVICDSCFGFGGSLLHSCSKCGGKGVVHTAEEVFLTVGPGAKHGERIVSTNSDVTLRGRIVIEE